MKKVLYAALFALVGSLAAPTLRAQNLTADATPSPAPATPGDKPAPAAAPREPKQPQPIPPDLRERFQQAREKALQSDPKLKELKDKAEAANVEYFKAMREAIEKVDPDLAAKLKEFMKDAPKMPGMKERMEKVKEKFGGKFQKGGDRPGFDKLSETDRQKLMAAHTAAESDPSVQAAKQKKESAKTPEERRQAEEEYRNTMRQVMLKSDPSLAGILDQLGKGPQPSPPPANP